MSQKARMVVVPPDDPDTLVEAFAPDVQDPVQAREGRGAG